MGLTLIFILRNPKMNGSTAGVMLSFASGVCVSIQQIFRSMRDFEVRGISLERTTEYRQIEAESQTSVKDIPEEGVLLTKEQNQWPESGNIICRGLCASYGDGQADILHDINLQIIHGQRVGIVGATGCGKSTLAKAFFRFVDLRGSIEIDGLGE